jgi:SAM-dependent methyltransferase
MGKVSSDDFVVDLGSGDGRFVIAAAKRGARALGVEYNPDMVQLAQANARKEGVADRASFVRGDIFETDFSQASVVTLYLLPNLNLRLRPKILDMKPGTRVLSNSFSMEDWEADGTIDVEGRTGYFWIVPAKVAGAWTLRTPSGEAELNLRQTFQKLEGSLKMGAKERPLQEAKMRGEEIHFTVAEGNPTAWEYTGRVHGNSIEGVAKVAGGSEVKWSAERRTAP